MITSVVVAALVLFALQALLVAIVAAVRRRGNIYVTIIALALATAPAAAFADRLLFGRTLDPDGRVFLAVMHLALGGFLFHFMTLPDRSVTLRILVELLLEPGHALSIDDLAARYGVRTMIGSRLAQLQDGRCLTIGPDDSITLLPGGQSFGRFVTGGRRLFHITSAN
jgi:hypothetical protein